MFRSTLIFLALALSQLAPAQKPNIILIFTDDQGYNDLSCFGSTTIKTPHIDTLAKEGTKLTSFYSPSPVCTPSRAGLLTGCYPKRVGLEKGVLFPYSKRGLHPEEVTIAEVLRSAGYATACIGKWHLGHHPPFLPTQQGFDYYYGIPYSNDMAHPDNRGKPKGNQDNIWLNQKTATQSWNTPLLENDRIIELPVDQRTITRRYTDKAIDFIANNKERPFFLYIPHSMPHIPLFVPEDCYDPNPLNAYKTVIEHIDSEVGRLVNALKAQQLTENTIIIFTSDNGPWLRFEHHGGSAKPLRDGKGTTFEGGQRVPCIIWGPNIIPANTTNDALASHIDLFPTLASLAGAEMKTRGPIDGLDLSATLTTSAPSPRDTFLYYSSQGKLEGIRHGSWKFLIKKNTPMLFNLHNDIAEKHNLAPHMPDKCQMLRTRMRKLDHTITNQKRPAANL
ncbi:sulfatase [Rubritalea tangerina]|uniref:Sulfatase n=1 Tax=Rubritalea tangerina TaxID=430798 RepID=A0ABW4ZB27_9BACT